MNKITIQFTLASLLFTSIWYAPLSHSAAATRAIQRQDSRQPAPGESASWLSVTPELQAHGFTEQNLAPFTNLVTQAREFLTQDDYRQFVDLISENVIIRNLLAEKNESHAVSCGLLAIANYLTIELYKQIEQLNQQSQTTQRELPASQKQKQTTAQLQESTLVLMRQLTAKQQDLATFKENMQYTIQTTRHELLAARELEQTTTRTLSTKLAELAQLQQQLAAKEHESTKFMQYTSHELLAAREREQALFEELATVKTMLAGTQHELEDIKRHPQILLPLYHFSEDAQPTD